ncbi:hypothetical protein Q7P37_010321 [Cladosporium fusiforme]
MQTPESRYAMSRSLQARLSETIASSGPALAFEKINDLVDHCCTALADVFWNGEGLELTQEIRSIAESKWGFPLDKPLRADLGRSGDLRTIRWGASYHLTFTHSQLEKIRAGRLLRCTSSEEMTEDQVPTHFYIERHDLDHTSNPHPATTNDPDEQKPAWRFTANFDLINFLPPKEGSTSRERYTTPGIVSSHNRKTGSGSHAERGGLM